eukprot:98679-Amphidinium_carterae.1
MPVVRFAALLKCSETTQHLRRNNPFMAVHSKNDSSSHLGSSLAKLKLDPLHCAGVPDVYSLESVCGVPSFQVVSGSLRNPHAL